MAMPAPAAEVDPGPPPHGTASLGAQERAVLAVLVAHQSRVVSRREIAREAGLTDLSERRCDSLLVGIRRVLGTESVLTVRSRGWMLAPAAVEAAQSLVGDCR